MTTITTSDVRAQMRAYIDSLALNTALELGLFWLLAETPQTAEEVAQAFDIPCHRSRSWLDLLADMGYLKRRDDSFVTSREACEAIVDAFSRECWGHLAEEEGLRYAFGVNLTANLNHPMSVWAGQRRVPYSYLMSIANDAEFARRFTRMLYELHLSLADAVAGTLDMRGVSRLMDLGGGSGVMSLALLRRHPDLTAIVVDRPHVCAAAREIAATRPEGQRLNFAEGDFLNDDLPADCEMVLACDLGVYSERFLKRVWCALKPGGRLVIVDEFDSPRYQPSRRFLRQMFFEAMTRSRHIAGRAPISHTQSLLARIGFQLSVEQNLSDGTVILQGRR